MTACNRADCSPVADGTNGLLPPVHALLAGSTRYHNAVTDWFDLQRTANEKNYGTTDRSKCAATCRVQLILNRYGDNIISLPGSARFRE